MKRRSSLHTLALALFYLMIFLIPFQTHPILSKVFGSLGPIRNVTPIKLFGGITFFFALLLSMSSEDSKKKSFLRTSAFISFFICYILTSAVVTGHVEVEYFSFFISILILFFCMTILCKNEDIVINILWVCLISMAVSSYSSIKHFALNVPRYGLGYRPGGTFGDPNYFSSSAIVIFPFIPLLYRKATSVSKKGAFIIANGMIILAFLLSRSRGAFLGLAIVCILTFIHTRKKIIPLIMLFLFVGIFLEFAPQAFFSRLYPKASGAMASTERRKALLIIGMRMIKETPFFGVGLNQFRAKSLEYDFDEKLNNKPGVAHNTYIEMAAENGIPVLLLFLLMLRLFFNMLNRDRKNFAVAYPASKDIQHAIYVSCVGFLITGAFLSAINTKFFWLSIFLGLSLHKHFIYRVKCQKG